MKNSPTKNKAAKPSKKDGVMKKDKEVRDSNDEHIDQDFPGFPDHPSDRRTIHNGSAGAFDATEHSHDEDDEDQDNDDFAMDR